MIPLTLLFLHQKRNLLIPLELSRVMHQGIPERQAPCGQPSPHRRKNCVSRNQAQTLAHERVTRQPPTLNCGSTRRATRRLRRVASPTARLVSRPRVGHGEHLHYYYRARRVQKHKRTQDRRRQRDNVYLPSRPLWYLSRSFWVNRLSLALACSMSGCASRQASLERGLTSSLNTRVALVNVSLALARTSGRRASSRAARMARRRRRVCLLFIHPRAPNLIGLRSAGTMPA